MSLGVGANEQLASVLTYGPDFRLQLYMAFLTDGKCDRLVGDDI